MADDLNNLQDYLDRLPDKVRAALSGVVEAQAVMLSTAQRQALQSLEQSPNETGNLEASCKVVPGANDLEFIVQAGGDLTTTEVRTGSGEAFDYGEAFEYGTTRQHARPFFWPTYRANREKIVESIHKAVSEALK